MRVKILEGCAVRLPRGVFHGGIECELSLDEIKENLANIDMNQALRDGYAQLTKPPRLDQEIKSTPIVATPESDLKNKLNTA